MASAKLQYADDVHLDEERDVVWSHLLDAKGERVLIVEMSREFLEDKHGTRWGDKGAVKASFPAPPCRLSGGRRSSREAR